MIKICIWGGWYGSKNAGDGAILLGIIEGFNRNFSDFKVTVFSRKSKFIENEYRIKAFSPYPQILNIIKSIAESDIFIIGGGTPFFETYKQIFNLSFYFFLSKLFMKKTMVYAVSSQEFKTNLGRFLIRQILNRMNIITVRDPETRKIFQKIGVKKKIYLTTDPAILVKPLENNKLNYILTHERLTDSTKPIIIICPRYLSETYAAKVYHPVISKNLIENYKQTIAKTADYLSSVAQIVFLPLHIEYPDNDLLIIEDIMKKITSNNVKIITKQYKPREIIALISRADLIIGTRLHSIIFAASNNVPLVAISYSPKVKGYMNSLGLEDYVFDIENIRFEDFKNKIDELWNKKDFIREHIKSRIVEHRKLALMNTKLCGDLIYGNKNVKK